MEDRFEKLQILQHNPEVWQGYVHASNGTNGNNKPILGR